MHCVWTLPTGEADYALRWPLIKWLFSRALPRTERRSDVRIARHERGIWQRRWRVLFLVPSLSLLSQTLTEWTQESDTPLHSFAVCSDSDVGKKRKQDDDTVQTFTHELRYPATTEARHLASAVAQRHDSQHMSVVFSTYHSIEVISQAQQKHGLAAFDLIICDEAHRTTGATFDDADESAFVKVHRSDYIQATKRLYMTATPRIYGDSAKASGIVNDANDWAIETMGNPRYPLELFCRVVTVSLETMEIVRGLPGWWCE